MGMFHVTTNTWYLKKKHTMVFSRVQALPLAAILLSHPHGLASITHPTTPDSPFVWPTTQEPR